MYIGMNARAERAKALRFKKPIIKGLSYDDITSTISTISEECETAKWFCEYDRNFLDALEGADEDAENIRLELIDLSADCDKFYEDISDHDIPRYFDEFFVTMCAQADYSDTLGWDSYERDYYSLDSYETGLAHKTANERLRTLTKDELLALTEKCLRIFTSYMSIQTRYDSLKSASDVLFDINLHETNSIVRLDELYEEVTSDYPSYAKVSEFDRIVSELPPEVWLR